MIEILVYITFVIFGGLMITAIITTIVGEDFGPVLLSALLISILTFFAIEHYRLIDCESTLPRNQQCELVAKEIKE